MFAGAALGLFAVELTSTDVAISSSSKKMFVEHKLPVGITYDLMDLGVADVDGNDLLDIFTSNHNSRQNLWVADSKGGYRDMLSAWGLDQDPAFPGIEISQAGPPIDKPGVYIYWQGRNSHSQFPLVIRTHRIKEVGRLEGTIRTFSGIKGREGSAFTVQAPVSAAVVGSLTPETTMEFATETDGELILEMVSPGLPVTLRIGGTIPVSSIYVGQLAVPPRSREFELAFQDRHGMAWFDHNGDGRLDVFISRGAIGGTLRMFPPSIQNAIEDELLVSDPDHRYRNVSKKAGFQKRGCSARKIAWVDFDNDGLMDLFINCQARGFVAGAYPKQLYRQTTDKRFVDVASDVGLGIPDAEVIDFVWFDADNDGFLDLFTYEDTGFYLHRNHGGKSFSREFIGRGKFARADRPQLRGTSDEYWFVDGKLVVADFAGTGALSVFSASKAGNTLLVNDGKGQFSIVDPPTLGLPAESATASWVDYDNDGLVDLFAVPQGLFRQRRDHTFESTGLLVLPSRKYMAAIVTWADLDNNGSRDPLIALLENFSLWTWWEKLYKTSADRFAWKLVAYRNVGSGNHWLQARLVGNPGNPQAIGARVTLETAEGPQTQVVGLNDGAFFSQGHYRLYFGLGAHPRADTMRIRWPDGNVEEFKDVEGDTLHVIREGAGVDPGRTAQKPSR